MSTYIKAALASLLAWALRNGHLTEDELVIMLVDICVLGGHDLPAIADDLDCYARSYNN